VQNEDAEIQKAKETILPISIDKHGRTDRTISMYLLYGWKNLFQMMGVGDVEVIPLMSESNHYILYIATVRLRK
jgi:hypothetical protein